MPFAVLLVSAAALAWEILLLRLFSLADWHDFAWMVISLALLGYGAGGTLLSLFRERLLRSFDFVAPMLAASFAVLCIVSIAIVRVIPFNSLELIWDPSQMANLIALYLALSLPFVSSSLFIGLCLTKFGDRIPALYQADLLGGGAGAIGILPLMSYYEPDELMRAVPVLGLLAACVFLWRRNIGSGRRTVLLFVFTTGLLPSLIGPRTWFSIEMSPYKPLAQTLRIPGMAIVERRPSPLGVVEVVESTEVPLRQAPGLSLSWVESLPEQVGIFVDGGGPIIVNRADTDEGLGYLDELTDAVVFHLSSDAGRSVLVLGAGGGTSVLSAIRHGATRVDGTETHREIVETVSDRYDEFAGHLYTDGRVNMHIGDSRSFLEARDQRFDIILCPNGDSDAPTAGLTPDYLLTTEGLGLMLRRLQPGGLAAFSFDLRLPPRAVPRFLSVASIAIARTGLHSGECVLIVRNWDRVTVVLKNGSFDRTEVENARRFCEERSFDLDWPRADSVAANRYHQLDEEYARDLASTLLSDDEALRDETIQRYKFRIEATSDDHPFFHQYFRWRSLPEILTLRKLGGASLLEWGYLLVLATLLQAIVASLVLILTPIVVRSGTSSPPAARRRLVTFFTSIGLAFLCLEMVLIHRMTLVLYHPVYAAAAVISGMLLFAGLGSGCSTRIAEWVSRLTRVDALVCVILGIALVTLATQVSLSFLADWIIGLGIMGRVAATILMIAPPAFLMGIPFPIALARLSIEAPQLLPLAWAVNGCASVVAAVLANLLAIQSGFAAAVVIALSFYGIAAASVPKSTKPN